MKLPLAPLRDGLTHIALPFRRKPLLSPLRLSFDPSGLHVRAVSADHTVFVDAHLPSLASDTPHAFTADMAPLLAYLSRLQGDEATVGFTDGTSGAATLVLSDGTRTFVVRASDAPQQEPPPGFGTFKDGIVHYRKGGAATTFCTLDPATLKEVAENARLVKAVLYPLHIKDGRLSFRFLQDGDSAIVSPDIPIEGPDLSVVLPTTLTHFLKNTTRPVSLQLRDAFPAAFIQDTEPGRIVHIFTPRVELG